MNLNEAQNLARAIALEGTRLTSGEFGRRARMTRQAAHRHLQILESREILKRSGAGRASRFEFVSSPLATWAFPRAGLDEATVWDQAASLQPIQELRPNVKSLLRHALTEIVNNAIDHSAGTVVTVGLDARDGTLTLAVTDDGIGIFRHIRETRGLASERDAIGVLQSGKVTTDPQRHAGEGLFFVSRMGDVVTIESGHTRWVVDNLRDDVSVQDIPERRGTRVMWVVSTITDRTTQEVFSEFTDSDLAFSKTETRIRLLQHSNEFVSRSEGRRLGEQLEPFEAITLDFEGVDGVGQGFVDELFRIWQRTHPKVQLKPVNMNSAVRLLVDRIRREVGSAPRTGSIEIEAGQPQPTVIVRVGNGTRTGSSSGTF